MLCRATPYEGKEPYLFFSYCHKDAEQVYRIIEQMVADGYRVWFDDGIHPGDDWMEVIADHLHRSAACIAAISPNSSASHNCRNEINFAIEFNKPFVSLMLEDFQMPLAMRLQLGITQYLRKYEFSDEAVFFQKLYSASSLASCLGEKPARNWETMREQELLALELERKKQEEEEAERRRRAQEALKAAEIAARKAEEEERERQRQEEAERKAREEAERKAREEAERKAREEAERKAREEAERKAREEAERKAREEAERKAREEAERKAREEAERKAREEAERKAREEAERKAREEAERKAREEAERKARKEAERKAREEAERKAREEAERKAREEAERKAREEAERKAREEAERKAREEAERKAREKAERKAREEAERKAREEAERKAREEAERKQRRLEEEGEKTYIDPKEDPDNQKTEEVQVKKAILIQPANLKIHPIRTALLKIGRSRTNCDLSFPDNMRMSRHHADLIQYHDKHYLLDAGSSNGTIVNGKLLEKNGKALLGDYAEIVIADEQLIFVSGTRAEKILSGNRLSVLRCEATGEQRILGEEPFPLGRAHRWAGGTLNDPKISRDHAAVVLKNGTYHLQDMKSTNGTFLNEQRLPAGEVWALRQGDTIRVGDTKLLFLELSFH